MIISHSAPHNLRLREHTRNAQEALAVIADQHSPISIAMSLEVDTIQFHDAGKAIGPFQDYILDPKSWRGDPMTKAHALASSVIAGLHLHSQGHPAPTILSVVYAIAGHHTRLLTRTEYERIFATRRVDILKDQLQSIDLAALSDELGCNLSGIFDEIGVAEIEDFRDLLEDCWDQMPSRDQEALWRFRITTQFAYSCLLEADRAQLIMGDLNKYAQPLGATALTEDRIRAHFAAQPPCQINQHRIAATQQALAELDRPHTSRIYTLSLPTGLGKTGIAAQWAAKCQEKWGPKKVIVVQPYLSITRQTEQVYRAILGDQEAGATLMPYHSISERRYNDSELGDRDQESFYLDTWKSGIIITTYDQLLLAMFSPKGRHQIRFHNLFDALIILDEYQAIPVCLWEPIAQMLDQIADQGNTRVLAMSATLPQYFAGSHALLPPSHKYQELFKRYTIHLNHKNPQTIDQFCAALPFTDWITNGQRAMVIVNTRRAARRIRNYARDKCQGKVPLYYLTTDITPKERMEQIDQIKAGKPCVVVATQCIEAGVDIDLDVIYSDYAPLDALIQRAGRLNRHGKRDRCQMYVVCLTGNSTMKPDADKVYDPIHLVVTGEVLLHRSEINEEDIASLCETYFQLLLNKKDTGNALVTGFLKWEEDIDVRTLLRGDRHGREVQFLVPDNPQIIEQLQAALEISDTFDRRRAMRDLAPALAQITISRYGSECPDPDTLSEWVGPFRVLHIGCYADYHGLISDNEA